MRHWSFLTCVIWEEEGDLIKTLKVRKMRELGTCQLYIIRVSGDPWHLDPCMGCLTSGMLDFFSKFSSLTWTQSQDCATFMARMDQLMLASFRKIL